MGETMRHHLKSSNKNPKINWNHYQIHEMEPPDRHNNEISPELEEEVLDYGIFLKQRVRRNIHKMHRQYNRTSSRLG
jgi:hypothetical protein